eukprot:GILJ01007905.1.p1 GENE.GILJ01007905.1~~GILJ01007905.1.p1  ORF type:complete len:1041 (+),score=138.79 GILJ01007905.1:137-3259(+)
MAHIMNFNKAEDSLKVTTPALSPQELTDVIDCVLDDDIRLKHTNLVKLNTYTLEYPNQQELIGNLLGSEAIAVLIQHLKHEDRGIRLLVARFLCNLAYHNPKNQKLISEQCEFLAIGGRICLNWELPRSLAAKQPEGSQQGILEILHELPPLKFDNNYRSKPYFRDRFWCIPDAPMASEISSFYRCEHLIPDPNEFLVGFYSTPKKNADGTLSSNMVNVSNSAFPGPSATAKMRYQRTRSTVNQDQMSSGTGSDPEREYSISPKHRTSSDIDDSGKITVEGRKSLVLETVEDLMKRRPNSARGHKDFNFPLTPSSPFTPRSKELFTVFESVSRSDYSPMSRSDFNEDANASLTPTPTGAAHDSTAESGAQQAQDLPDIKTDAQKLLEQRNARHSKTKMEFAFDHIPIPPPPPHAFRESSAPESKSNPNSPRSRINSFRRKSIAESNPSRFKRENSPTKPQATNSPNHKEIAGRGSVRSSFMSDSVLQVLKHNNLKRPASAHVIRERPGAVDESTSSVAVKTTRQAPILPSDQSASESESRSGSPPHLDQSRLHSRSPSPKLERTARSEYSSDGPEEPVESVEPVDTETSTDTDGRKSPRVSAAQQRKAELQSRLRLNLSKVNQSRDDDESSGMDLDSEGTGYRVASGRDTTDTEGYSDVDKENRFRRYQARKSVEPAVATGIDRIEYNPTKAKPRRSQSARYHRDYGTMPVPPTSSRIKSGKASRTAPRVGNGNYQDSSNSTVKTTPRARTYRPSTAPAKRPMSARSGVSSARIPRPATARTPRVTSARPSLSLSSARSPRPRSAPASRTSSESKQFIFRGKTMEVASVYPLDTSTLFTASALNSVPSQLSKNMLKKYIRAVPAEESKKLHAEILRFQLYPSGHRFISSQTKRRLLHGKTEIMPEPKPAVPGMPMPKVTVLPASPKMERRASIVSNEATPFDPSNTNMQILAPGKYQRFYENPPQPYTSPIKSAPEEKPITVPTTSSVLLEYQQRLFLQKKPPPTWEPPPYEEPKEKPFVFPVSRMPIATPEIRLSSKKK